MDLDITTSVASTDAADGWKQFARALRDKFNATLLTTTPRDVPNLDVCVHFPTADDARQFDQWVRYAIPSDRVIAVEGGLAANPHDRVKFTASYDEFKRLAAEALRINGDDPTGTVFDRAWVDSATPVPGGGDETTDTDDDDADRVLGDTTTWTKSGTGDGDSDPETCPECGSENTTGFSTGDRVCRECNHNYDPEP